MLIIIIVIVLLVVVLGMFVVTGLFLIGLAVYLERKRRSLMKRMAEPATTLPA